MVKRKTKEEKKTEESIEDVMSEAAQVGIEAQDALASKTFYRLEKLDNYDWCLYANNDGVVTLVDKNILPVLMLKLKRIILLGE